MLCDMPKKQTAQQNFHLGPEMVRAFRQWTAKNGYNPSAVFRAGLKLLEQMPHEQRMEYFDGLDVWQEGFVEQNTPTEPESGEGPGHGESDADHAEALRLRNLRRTRRQTGGGAA